MSERKFIIVGIGEVLWDVLPDGQKLGGAPANFAYVSNCLGGEGVVLSRVGDDPAGRAIVEELGRKNLSTARLQSDPRNRTGVVNVSFEDGQPAYEIVAPAAWDFLELSDDWRALAGRADAVCFGSLAQRGAVSRATVREFVGATRGLRVFDVNLRQDFFSPEILGASFGLANVVKLNHEELPVIAKIFGVAETGLIEQARALLVKFDLRLICVTRGANGSVLTTPDEISAVGGRPIEVRDTIGAGDAFTAAMVNGLLRGRPLFEINEFANRTGAFVASQTGAMPEFPKDFCL
ncbi:MAG: carbohydrate kinase [Acidobacteria bacterium]|nr:carbohydrate kinase [Acidobacteriota bacterium]